MQCMEYAGKLFVFVLLLSFTLLNVNKTFAQENVGSESAAVEYFKDGNYEKALPLFTVLINKSPDNAMYNYYYGVCLIKQNRYETAAKEALLNAVVDKTPENCNFYLGNYFQALENWGEAIEFYKRFKGSKHEKKILEFDKYYDMCMKRINPFKVSKGDEIKVFVDTTKNLKLNPEQKNFQVPDTLQKEWFNFDINDQLTYHSIGDFKSEAAKILFVKAWIATYKNDSIVKNTDLLRKAHEETNNVSARLGLVQRIVDSEQQSYQLLSDREKYFEQARVKESSFWDKASHELLIVTQKNITERENTRNAKIIKDLPPVAKVEAADTVKVQKVIVNVDRPEIKKEPEISSSDKNEIIFKVQIGSFYKGKLPTAFKNMYPMLSKLHKIDKFTEANKNETYTIGNFADYQSASKFKNQIINEGVKGAFLTAFQNGKRLPVVDALKIISNQ